MLLYVYNLTLREIGEILGVTESRICQLHSQILKTSADNSPPTSTCSASSLAKPVDSPVGRRREGCSTSARETRSAAERGTSIRARDQ